MPDQVAVSEFAGSMTDGRTRFLEWCEKVKDRCELYNHAVAKALTEVAGKGEEITEEESRRLGVDSQANSELQGFLKEHTLGTAAFLQRWNVFPPDLDCLLRELGRDRYFVSFSKKVVV